jgi:retron-type reverse transcriptase
MDEAKPFLIPKREVWEAFKRVKANQGAAGVDGQSIEDFEANLSGNLYKLWNRMSSGSYFPPPVRRVDIPKASGGIRPLGIPTVADRIAQEVADSDDLARVYRFDLAQDSEMISPGARGVLTVWFLALAKPRGQS